MSISTSSGLHVEVPEALAPLLEPKRYKAAYGGRGGAKSHFFAEQLIVRCYAKTTRAVCIREVQNSIRDSVRQLLVDKIKTLGVGEHFEILESEIRGSNGSLIIFRGMQAYNADNIKSLEDYDIAWVEEAQSLSETSLRLLRPTIRKEGSEIWFSWNPRHETDAVDKFFRGGKPRDDAIVVSVNWYDNPWFPDVLRKEKDSDYEADRETADNVWGGGYELVSEASYYGRLLATAEKEGRIGIFPHNSRLMVSTSWDLGVDDYTSIWFFQHDGEWVTAIDYYESSGVGPDVIVPEALPELNPDIAMAFLMRQERGRDEPYRYERHYLPHDVKTREWGAGAKQRSLVLMGMGVKPLNVGVAQNPVERINAARALMPKVRFNRTPAVMLGVSRLRRYARRFSEQLQTYGQPLHDENSHGADAFGEYAVNCGLIMPAPEPEKPRAQPKGTVYLPGPPKPSVGTRIRL